MTGRIPERMKQVAQCVKMRIYKVYYRQEQSRAEGNAAQQPDGPRQKEWQEVNVLDKLGFEVDESDGGSAGENEEAKGDPRRMGKDKDSGMQLD